MLVHTIFGDTNSYFSANIKICITACCLQMAWIRSWNWEEDKKGKEKEWRKKKNDTVNGRTAGGTLRQVATAVLQANWPAWNTRYSNPGRAEPLMTWVRTGQWNRKKNLGNILRAEMYTRCRIVYSWSSNWFAILHGDITISCLRYNSRMTMRSTIQPELLAILIQLIGYTGLYGLCAPRPERAVRSKWHRNSSCIIGIVKI